MAYANCRLIGHREDTPYNAASKPNSRPYNRAYKYIGDGIITTVGSKYQHGAKEVLSFYVLNPFRAKNLK